MGARRDRSSFDWLPAGWKMEIRARNTGKTDRYYIDPVSGYSFRSMNEVFRYLDAGIVGRRVFKSKDMDLKKQKSRDLTSISPAKTGKLRSSKNTKSPKLPRDKKNKKIALFSYAGDVEEPPMEIIDLQKFATLMPCESKEKCSEFIFPLVGELIVNLRIENPIKITDSTMKITSSNQVTEGEESTDEDEDINVDSFLNLHYNSDKEDDLDDVLTWSDEYVLKEEEEEEDVKTTGVNVNNNIGPEEQEGLWNDPCIEFAIKTLTGELPVDRDTKDTIINPGPLMTSSTGNVTTSVNKEKVQQKCLTKGGGGGLNWPTFADHRVTQFSWTNGSYMHSDIFQQKF